MTLILFILAAWGALPVGAQPFADNREKVPGWAHVALESLIARGLVPDTPPRQRQRLNRLEWAGLLAQALIRLTTSQTTDSAAGRVTARDLASIQRLLNEFESELASLDVRVDVVQRRLQEIAQEIRPVRITGDFRFRYEIARMALNNPGTGPVAPASSQPAFPAANARMRLAFDGG